MLARHFTWGLFSWYYSYFLHKGIWVYFRVGVIFAKKTKAQKTWKLPPSENFHVYSSISAHRHKLHCLTFEMEGKILVCVFQGNLIWMILYMIFVCDQIVCHNLDSRSYLQSQGQGHIHGQKLCLGHKFLLPSWILDIWTFVDGDQGCVMALK